MTDLGIGARVEAALTAADLDALLTVTAEGSRYLSGAPLPFQLFYPRRPTVVFWPRDGDAVLFTGADQLAGPRRSTWIGDLRGYVEEGRTTAVVLGEMLAEAVLARGLGSARVGYEDLTMPLAVHREVTRNLPDLELVAADPLLDRLRATKTDAELDVLVRVARAAEIGTRRAFAEARAGWSERDVGGRIATRIVEEGADTVPMMLLGVGEGARMFGEPTDRVLEPGHFVRMDLNAVLRGYYADLGRMAVVGGPTPAQRDIYAAHVEINRRVLAAMRPGVSCAEVFAVEQAAGAALGVELLEQPSIGFGHAISTNPNHSPFLMASDNTVLERNMVFNIEPDVIGPEGERVHLEEMVVVTDAGGVLLTGTTDWSKLPVIAA